MKIKILSWNVRGANDNEKRKIIKSVIKSNRELKKLEWTVSYKRVKLVSNEGKFGGASGPGIK